MTRNRILAARILAVTADAIQLGIWPLFVGGATSPVNDVLDVAVGAAMVWLVGWHWVFIPSFAAELIPFVDMAPTWTVAVMIATRSKGDQSLPAAPTPGTLPTTTPRARGSVD
ncbi:MAG: hypothetical protein IT359_02115 [Gemmatimonadaceae bacterium]|nr:hypothetical protein [Gemmatimonadaceae bacterium]